ncbi:tetraacyldisaccharide 4'-kinase [Marinibactrum halimedae]|uniref:Tetraacyldisaccharide 4'-kinase n=2 Tax=Marinibactrum halimedae TaxID=1444977 RepID=A0AA37WLW3_9GAMM|nr:tetraacyldisaccharide 4'-kinase [Marinibactrum halimedae]GLS26449.1 tetraacyldisaccharide 4'-kinase [Marinibactrum halimedae]
MSFRRKEKDQKVNSPLPVPVVVVGNITVGGTGKTPLLQALSLELRQRGWNPGIVSRGYGGARSSEPLRVLSSTSVSECGDEPKLLADTTGCPVVVDVERYRGANFLVELGCTIILSDDGLQHYRLPRDVEIVVVDGARGFGNGRLLPVGPLRESISRCETVDYIISNGAMNTQVANLVNDMNSSLVSATMEILPTCFKQVATGEEMPLDSIQFTQDANAITGIGNPNRFANTLRSIPSISESIPLSTFPDHHSFTFSDLEAYSGQPLLMTSKDAVKCQSLIEKSPLLDASQWWSVVVGPRLSTGFYDQFIEKIDRIKKDKLV